MNIYILIFLLTIVIIVPIFFRTKIKEALLSYKKAEKKINVARTLLVINVWLSVPLGLAVATFFQALGHAETIDWSFFILMVLGFIGWFLLISYLAFVSFSKQNIFAQVYIWGFCLYFSIIGFPIFTIFGVLIALGQLSWYKARRENK